MAALGGMLAVSGSVGAVNAATSATKAPSSMTPAATPAFPTTITVNNSGKTVGQINNHYVGLSFESSTLNQGHFDTSGNLARLLWNLGPAVMRFGGNAVDDGTFTHINPGALIGLTRVARASGWTVLYSEDLAHYDQAVTTADARAVATALGPSLSAIACGNEPDSYPGWGYRPPTWGKADFLQEAAACLAAVRAGAPSAPLEGADLTGAAPWLLAYAQQETGQLVTVGQHLYQAGCIQDYVGWPSAKAAAKLLSPAMRTGAGITFKFTVADSQIAKAKPIMSETNSICSGGLPGVSDSFASALWSIEYMLTGAQAGIRGMNIHDRFITTCTPYSPICPVTARSTRFTVRPIYYGMLFTHLLGTGFFLPVSVNTGSTSRVVTAFVLRTATGGKRIMLENLTGQATNVTLNVGGSARTAGVIRLTAPGLLAKSGVAIQGAQVAVDGRIKVGPPTAIRCATAGKCQLTLAPYTAAIVSVA